MIIQCLEKGLGIYDAKGKPFYPKKGEEFDLPEARALELIKMHGDKYKLVGGDSALKSQINALTEQVKDLESENAILQEQLKKYQETDADTLKTPKKKAPAKKK